MVAAAHEVMNFFLPQFLCEDVHTLRVCDVHHTKFDAILSLHNEGQWGHIWSFTGFLCKSNLTGKHPSDPTVLRQLPVREPKNSMFTGFLLTTSMLGPCSGYMWYLSMVAALLNGLHVAFKSVPLFSCPLPLPLIVCSY